MAKSSLAQDITTAATDLATILTSNDHGVLRGTMEAVLTEAQGGRLASDKGRGTHKENFENALKGLIGNHQKLHDKLSEVGRYNWQAARLVSMAVRSLRDTAQTRAKLMKNVQALARELILLHPQKHSTTPLMTGQRETSLITRQLNTLGGEQAGLRLVPGGLAEHPWVRETLDDIKKLPVTADQAGDQVAAVMMGVRTSLQTSVEMMDSPIVAFFGPTTNLLLSIGGGLNTIAVPEQEDE